MLILHVNNFFVLPKWVCNTVRENSANNVEMAIATFMTHITQIHLPNLTTTKAKKEFIK